MASDWSFLRGRFPSLPDTPAYEDVLRAARAEQDGRPLAEVAESFRQLLAKKAAADLIVSGLEAEVAAIQAVIIGRLEDQGAESLKLKAGGTLSIDRTQDAKIDRDGGREKLREWIEKEGMHDLLSVHGQTLSSMCRQRFAEGLEIPDGVELVPRNKLKFTGRKG